ncbi:unnamed protein product [Fraxinus pennsylvanica]|uniref:Uncharacterized protein n=1 Tax=Fraxinus pennsylvanica TaxID=56036 RepID=A0AAD1ZZ13_9LAMI|nr:unnamed protein product [Fraxinus pennsylvanica]
MDGAHGEELSKNTQLKELGWRLLLQENVEDGLVNHSEDSFTGYKGLAMDVMLSLRTACGLDLESFGVSLLLSICEVYRPYVESGHMICSGAKRRNITLDGFSFLLSDKHELN